MYLASSGSLALARPGTFRYPVRGLGGEKANTGIQVGSTVATAASGKIATVLGVSVPVIGAAIAGVTLALTALLNRKGPKQREIATQIVNQAAEELQRNVDAYLSGPRTTVNYQAAVQNFWIGWNGVLEQCGDPALGNPGKVCIAERERGGVAPWCPTPDHTGCDWFVQYLDPIEKDPDAGRDDPPTLKEQIFGEGGIFGAGADGSSGLSRWLPWAIAASALTVAFVGDN